MDEQQNLVLRDPDRARALQARLAAWRKDVVAVMPIAPTGGTK